MPLLFLQITGFGLAVDDPCLPVGELDGGTGAGLAGGALEAGLILAGGLGAIAGGGAVLAGACGGGI